MDLDTRIKQFVDKLYNYWLISVCLAVAVIFFFTKPSLWWIAAFFGILFSYVITMVVGAIIFSERIQKERLENDSLDSQEVEIVEWSPEIIGRYMDNDIHEWIEIATNGKRQKLFYSDIAQVQNDEFVVPDDDCILFNGLIYRAST